MKDIKNNVKFALLLIFRYPYMIFRSRYKYHDTNKCQPAWDKALRYMLDNNVPVTDITHDGGRIGSAKLWLRHWSEAGEAAFDSGNRTVSGHTSLLTAVRAWHKVHQEVKRQKKIHNQDRKNQLDRETQELVEQVVGNDRAQFLKLAGD